MPAVDAGIKQRDMWRILVCGSDSRASHQVPHPLDLLEGAKIAEKELRRKGCAADLCDEIEQIDGPLESCTSGGSGGHGPSWKRQVSGFHCNIEAFCGLLERRIRLGRSFRAKTEPD